MTYHSGHVGSASPVKRIWQLIPWAVTTLLAIGSLSMNLSFRQELAFPEKVSNLHSLYFTAYLDREFPKPIVLDGTKYTTVKRARWWLRDTLRHPSETWQRDQYAARLHEYWIASTDTTEGHELHRQLAYELSVMLERLGALAASGAVPVEIVVEVNGYQLVEDWIYAKAHVKERIRNAEDPIARDVAAGAQPIPFSRRHAEWLACIAALYMHKYWHGGDRLDYYLTEMGGVDEIRERERQLRRFDQPLMPKPVAHKLAAFVDRL